MTPKLRQVFQRVRLSRLTFALALGCSERDPPAVTPPSHQFVQASAVLGGRSGNGPEVPAPAGSASASTQPSSAFASDSAAAPKASPPPAEEAVPVPVLVDSKGETLPQTDTLPRLDSVGFRQRIALLFQAIAEDRPELADDAFFPVLAYEQVKAIARPARDHKYRLMTAFHRNIHEYHAKVNHQPGPLKLLAVAPSRQPTQWMKPGSEGNKLPYHRMLRAQLRYADATGKEYGLTITSMISWRGEWYVVHLDGFK